MCVIFPTNESQPMSKAYDSKEIIEDSLAAQHKIRCRCSKRSSNFGHTDLWHIPFRCWLDQCCHEDHSIHRSMIDVPFQPCDCEINKWFTFIYKQIDVRMNIYIRTKCCFFPNAFQISHGYPDNQNVFVCVLYKNIVMVYGKCLIFTRVKGKNTKNGLREGQNILQFDFEGDTTDLHNRYLFAWVRIASSTCVVQFIVHVSAIMFSPDLLWDCLQNSKKVDLYSGYILTKEKEKVQIKDIRTWSSICWVDQLVQPSRQ